jgi:hypothetical protein
MNYDDWKLETAEDEDERINGSSRRRAARGEYLADFGMDPRDVDDFADALRMPRGDNL